MLYRFTRLKFPNRFFFPQVFTLYILLGLTTSCLKTTKVIQTPQRIQKAKVLTSSQILNLLTQKAEAVKSIQVSTMKAYFVGGDEEYGKVERYLGIPGYILAQKPSQLRITLQNPVTKSSLADLVCGDKEIRMWIPSKNKFFIGPIQLDRINLEQIKVNNKESENPLLNLRPQHFFPALLFNPPVETEDMQYFLEEEASSSARYYVVGVILKPKDAQTPPQLARRIWLERYDLQVTKEKFYGQDGRVLAEINYSRYQEVNGVNVAHKIDLQRFPEHYSMTLLLDRVKINLLLQEKSFQLNRIPSAELIDLSSNGSAVSP